MSVSSRPVARFVLPRIVVGAGALTLSAMLGCTPSPVAQPPHPAPVSAPAPTTTALGPNTTLDPAALPYDAGAAAIEEALALHRRGDDAKALSHLDGVDGAAVALERARLLLALGRPSEARVALETAATDSSLVPLVTLEAGRIALALGDDARARAALVPLVEAGGPLASQVVAPLAELLERVDPSALVTLAPTLEALAPKDDAEIQSALLGLIGSAFRAVGDTEAAGKIARRRYVELPEARATPTETPEGVVLSPTDALARAERLLDKHRNDRAVVALEAIDPEGLEPEARCQRQFALGLAERKLRHYARAEEQLTAAVEVCHDEDFVRRASYLRIKVISIREGLRAIEPIDAFAAQFAGHSMVDDVLFWAGDVFQRRGRDAEAESYYRRAAALEPPGDHCGEARWRLAWMGYRRGDLEQATRELDAMLAAQGCVTDRFDRARATYWLGRVAEESHDDARAAASYRRAVDIAPADFYGQAARRRLEKLDVAGDKGGATLPSAASASLPLCPGAMADEPAFRRGYAYLLRGLVDDAAAELRQAGGPLQHVTGSSHADSLGVATERASRISTGELNHCGVEQSKLLLALLLDRAGAHREAHWRLRTDFASALDALPDAHTLPLWQAAYPLALRSVIEGAENEMKLPPLLLQALVREESALDPRAISWAGAYGLTQLLPSIARAAAGMLDPPETLAAPEDLLEPKLSARLGAAFLAHLVERYGGSVPLAIAAYNAGEPTASRWWKRYQGEPLDVFAEEMTIKETRGYVKRVLRTYGIYRWLYAGGRLELPVEEALPAVSKRRTSGAQARR